jgi:dsRNA-specific ribonuclease
LIGVTDEAKAVIGRILSTRNLSTVGKFSKYGGSIERMIRPRAALRPSKRRNVLELFKDDVQAVGHDRDRQIARAIKAIIGAVYFDGGYEAARRVMAQLRLTIQAT